MQLQKKICLIGDFAVGKTSLIRRYVFNTFDENYLTTIGVHITKKEIIVQNSMIKLLIWDLAGEDSFQKITPAYLAGSSGFIIVGDITRSNTLTNLTKHLHQAKLQKQLPTVIAINKSDLIHKPSELKKIESSLALPEEIPWFFTSSKSGQNVEQLFIKLSALLLANHPKN